MSFAWENKLWFDAETPKTEKLDILFNLSTDMEPP